MLGFKLLVVIRKIANQWYIELASSEYARFLIIMFEFELKFVSVLIC